MVEGGSQILKLFSRIQEDRWEMCHRNTIDI